VEYHIDPGASRFTVRAFASGMLSSVGHNPTFQVRELAGRVTFDPAAPGSTSLRLRVGASSLALTDSVSDKDRREIERATNQEVLESATFPEIVFEGTRVVVDGSPGGPLRATVDGVLTLHGVTRPHQVQVRIYPSGDMLRAQGEATVRQSDFRIGLVSVAGGMLKVKDEVKLAFDLVARVAPGSAASPDQAAAVHEGGSG
jgi:polyisoprenoid-binding protein YceI